MGRTSGLPTGRIAFFPHRFSVGFRVKGVALLWTLDSGFRLWGILLGVSALTSLGPVKISFCFGETAGIAEERMLGMSSAACGKLG